MKYSCGRCGDTKTIFGIGMMPEKCPVCTIRQVVNDDRLSDRDDKQSEQSEKKTEKTSVKRRFVDDVTIPKRIDLDND